MFDRELVVTDLRNVVWAIDQIHKRCASIRTPGDFTRDDAGLEKLDSINPKNGIFTTESQRTQRNHYRRDVPTSHLLGESNNMPKVLINN